MSGKAYVCEMKFRTIRLHDEGQYFSWIIYKFYDYYAGYTKDYSEAFKVVFIFLLAFFPIVYIIFDCKNLAPIWCVNTYCSFTDIYKKNFSASLPPINSELQYNSWWIKSFQTIISTILLAFFISGLRQRFKQ